MRVLLFECVYTVDRHASLSPKIHFQKKKNRKSVTFVFSITTPSLKRNNFFLL